MSSDRQLSTEKNCDVVASTSNAQTFPEFFLVNINHDNSCAPQVVPEQLVIKSTDTSSENIENDMTDEKYAKELRRTKLHIEKLNKKLELSQKKYKRLQEKATSLAFLLKQLQDKQAKEEV